MSDEGTASALVLAGAIIQIIITIISLISTFWSIMVMAPFFYDPYFGQIFLALMLSTIIMSFVFGIIGLIFVILWLKWRNEPSQHRTGLIVTGVLGLLFAGFIPGLLVLIGGAVTPEPDKFIEGVPSWTPTPTKALKFCPVCGTQIESDDKYCWKCGAALSR